MSNNLYNICIIPEKNVFIVTRNAENIPLFNIRHNFYKNCFLTLKIIDWINLVSNLWNSENIGIFENNILKCIRPKPSNFFNCCDLRGIILITRLCLELSHLREHKLKYCSCGSSIESISQFLLHCPIFNKKIHTFLSTLKNSESKILESTDSYLTKTYGSTLLETETSKLVLNSFFPMFSSDLSENIRKPLVFWRFQAGPKGNIGKKMANATIDNILST